VLKEVRCSCAYFKSGASILYSTTPANFTKNPSHQERKVEVVLHKISAAVRCEMDVPDLKCVREHRTPLSTRYVPLFVCPLQRSRSVRGGLPAAMREPRGCLPGDADARSAGRQSPCLFRLFAASGHQKLLQTAKHSAFQPASIKFVWVKIIQNQHKHIIS
jgi:hypothetical protein